MDQEDLALFRQIEAWMTAFTGYPTVRGYEEFLYEPDKPLQRRPHRLRVQPARRARLRGRAWDLFTASGCRGPRSSSSTTSDVTRDDLVKLAWWDREENAGRSSHRWRPFDHPQLGAVEIGGIDPRVGIWNPPFHELPALCAAQALAFLRVAALAPRLAIADIKRHPLPGGLTRVEIAIKNDGYLGSYGLPSAKKLDFNEPVYATAIPDGCALVDPGAAHQTSATSTAGATACTPAEPARVPRHPRHHEHGVGIISCPWDRRARRADRLMPRRIRDDAHRRVRATKRVILGSVPRYAIGDIQGCMASLDRLLVSIDYSAAATAVADR